MALEDKDLKTRLTDAQISDLETNLPLADIIGKHEDHRLKAVPDEVILTYNLSSILRYEIIDIQLIPNASQVLEIGEYIVHSYSDVYGALTWHDNDIHIEIYVGGAWRDFPENSAGIDNLYHVFSDGENMRVFNADGVNTYRLVGIRRY